MLMMPESPVKEIPISEAIKVSLNNYYDVLKETIGGLGAKEFLQLKLVADTLDLSDEKASAGGYRWHSYYRLVKRSDHAIAPTPIDDTVEISAVTLTEQYGRFIRRLRNFVVRKVLSPAEQIELSELQTKINDLTTEIDDLVMADRRRWKEVAEAMGYDVGDRAAYVQWSSQRGSLFAIQAKIDTQRNLRSQKRTILAREYPDPDDKAIIDAEDAFENPSLRLRYPVHPDYTYPEGDQFNPSYLATLPLGPSGLFDDLHVFAWDQSIGFIKTTGAGGFSADFNHQSEESRSITTDWNVSGKGGWGPFKAKVSASEHTKIQEDFKKVLAVGISGKAAFRVNILYPAWFKPSLFEHKRVKENIREFEEFFGKQGTLRYYPTSLIVVRGFGITFTSAQKWTYDYERSFSVSGGASFRAFGIPFGVGGGYSSNVKEHKIDQTDTTLTLADDQDTLRFVGFTVARNTVFEETIEEEQGIALGDDVRRALLA